MSALGGGTSAALGAGNLALNTRRQVITSAPAKRTPAVPLSPAPGWVNFYALDGSVDLSVLMNGEAKLTGGGNGWQEQPREGQGPVSYWTFPESYKQSIPVLFGFGDNDLTDSQEGRIGRLYSLMRSPGARVPPPVVMIAGPTVERADLMWVVQTIDPGDGRRRDADGDRILKAYTVNLVQYTELDPLVERSPARKHSAKGGQGTKGRRGPTTYRVKQGDTLPQIAAKMYGDATQWKKIAHANGIRDPRSLKVGQQLRIPR
jgi:hypothetical protein